MPLSVGTVKKRQAQKVVSIPKNFNYLFSTNFLRVWRINVQLFWARRQRKLNQVKSVVLDLLFWNRYVIRFFTKKFIIGVVNVYDDSHSRISRMHFLQVKMFQDNVVYTKNTDLHIKFG